MRLHKCLLTKNDCYKAGVKIRPCGVMVHSTGANNPNLRRYIQPNDGKLGENRNGNDWNRPKPGGTQVCVHAFIGKLADGTVATYQTLPWDIRGWHSGYANRAARTNANKMGYIGFEICEDALTDPGYFKKVYREAVELTAYLCKMYGLDPTSDGVVICHCEGHRRGIASNHADVMHWFPRHGKSMDTFRADVAKELGKKVETAKLTTKKVVTGDTLAKIAAANDTTVQALAHANGLKNPNVIHVGEVLMLEDSVAAAVDKLTALGVINSPDYWKSQATKTKYLDILLKKAAQAIKKAGRRAETPEKGLEALVKAGVINTPDYWAEAVKTVPNMGALLCALGGSV